MNFSLQFEQLMGHLNSEENEMADLFLKDLEEYVGRLEEDSNHLQLLVSRGVDNWDGYVGPDTDECEECGMDEEDCECGGDK